MRNTVQEAEETEPLLAKELYDTVRKANEQKIPDALKVAEQLVDLGVTEEAAKASRHAGQGIDQLREGVERAAKSVLGDETAALRRAEGELEDLADQIDREIAQATGREPGLDPAGTGRAKQPATAAPRRAEPAAKGQPGRAGSNRKNRKGTHKDNRRRRGGNSKDSGTTKDSRKGQREPAGTAKGTAGQEGTGRRTAEGNSKVSKGPRRSEGGEGNPAGGQRGQQQGQGPPRGRTPAG